MSTITKELAKLFRKITNSEIDAEGNAHVVLSPADSLLINNARIALASLEAEPVAWLLSGGGAKNDVRFDSSNAYADPLREVTPLYAAPQLPKPAVVMQDEMEISDDMNLYQKSFAQGHNACRAAMLQGSETVQEWIECSERMPDDDTLCIAIDDLGVVWTAHYDDGLMAPDIPGSVMPVFTHWMPLPAAPQQEVKK